ncbi:FtsX-like permease family protein [Massilia sp. W12]|uniref:ABC transporter permease n=1 Tax=Massilia sp. W12 TaxID=3126507 RepID=UPI0030D1048E
MSGLMLWSALAWRNVWRNRRRSLLTLAIVAVACCAILLAYGFILASFEGLKFSIVQGGAGHVQLAHRNEFLEQENKPLEYGLSSAQRASLQREAQALGGVKKILPRLYFQGLISNGEITRSFSGEGLDAEAEWQAFGKQLRIVSGDYLEGGDDKRYSIVLGQQLAQRLHAKPGDTLTLVTAAVSGQMNAMDVTLAGVISSGIAARDTYYLAMPLGGAQELLRSEKVSRLTVLLQQDLSAAQAQRMQAALPAGFAQRSWRELNPIYDQLVTLYRGQFIVLGGILLAVAFLAILNAIIMNVMERTREIGSLRALGIDAARIRAGFALESFYLCALGSAAGAALAWGGGWLCRHIHIMMPAPPGSTSGYPLQLLWDGGMALQVSLALIALGMLAAWLASRHVASLDILDAINTH